MTIFLILAPFGAFTSLMLVTSAAISLFTSAAVGLGVVGLDLVRGRQVKILGAGSTMLFAALGAYVALIDPHLGNSAVKIAVDCGVLAISLGSMLIRYPFSLQYALEAVPAETAAIPGFLRANYVITGAWTASFVLMLAGNLAVTYVPGLPLWTGLAIAFAARNSAIYFTKWYPEHRKLKDRAAAGHPLPETR